MNWYIENSIEIIKSGSNDPDLILMAKTSVRNEILKHKPYIEECESKNIEVDSSISIYYNSLLNLI